KHRFYASWRPCCLFAIIERARVLLCPRGSRLLIASRYQSSHTEERYLLYNRASIPPGDPQVRNDVIVSSPMRTESQRSATSRPEFAGSLFLASWLPGFLASTFPDLHRKNSLLPAKNSLFRCVGNSAARPLSFLTDWTSKSAAEDRFSQIPCSFPC